MMDLVDFLLGAVGGVMVAIMVMIVGFALSPIRDMGPAIVVGKTSRPRLGSAPVWTANGQTAVVTTYHGRRLVVLVRRPSGEVLEASTARLDWFATIKNGDEVRLLRQRFVFVEEWYVE